MRFLLWFTFGFGAACGVCAYLLPCQVLIWLCLAIAVLAAALAAAFLKKRGCKQLSVLLLGCTVSFLWFSIFHGMYLSAPQSMDGKTQAVDMTASSYSQSGAYGVSVDATLRISGKSYKVRVYVNDAAEIKPGQRIFGSFRFRYTADGGAQQPLFHRGDGIFLLAYPVDNTEIRQGEDTWRYFPAHLGQRMLTILQDAFPEDTAAFARALLLGEDSQLDYGTNTALKLSGIRHVIAVSGLHVAILCSLVYAITGKKSWLTALIGIPVMLLFAAVTGFTPSITRASIMQILMLLAMVFRKEYDPATALSFACLCILVVNPLAITSVGFQLSVGSMVGIFLFSGRVYQRIRKWKWFAKVAGKSLGGRLLKWVIGSVSVTLGAMVVTTPLCAFYFGTVSLIGILTNLLTLWIVSFIFCGVLCVCVVGALWLSGAQCLAWVIAWPIRYVLLAAKVLCKFPLAAVYTQSPYIIVWLVLCYGLLGAFLLSRGKRVAVLGCCAALGLCAALLASWAEPVLDRYRLTVLDVGQGQCILLQSGGKTFMVDCGGDYQEGVADLAAETLLSQGVSHLDGLILTHYDSDHCGAAEYLMTRMPVDHLFLPHSQQEPLADVLTSQCAGTVTTVQEDICLRYGSTALTVFAGGQADSANERSLCVLFQPENCDILITGDRGFGGEAELLRTASLPELEVLVAGHHGAATSSGTPLLAATMPACALISVGADNPYGHPASAVLERLESIGCIIRRTDLEGTILIRG